MTPAGGPPVRKLLCSPMTCSVVTRQRAADDRAPVPALGPVPVVAEAGHQRREHVGHLLRVVARLGGLPGEAEPRQRGDDHVESVRGVAAVGSWIRERAHQVHELDERAWPSVGEQERHRVGVGRAYVDEVHVQPVDRGGEVIELVEAAFLGAPVEAVLPVGKQVLQIGAIGAVLPGLTRPRVREARAREPLPQVRQRGVGHRDTERPNRLGVARGRRLHRRTLGRTGAERQSGRGGCGPPPSATNQRARAATASRTAAVSAFGSIGFSRMLEAP